MDLLSSMEKIVGKMCKYSKWLGTILNMIIAYNFDQKELYSIK